MIDEFVKLKKSIYNKTYYEKNKDKIQEHKKKKRKEKKQLRHKTEATRRAG